MPPDPMTTRVSNGPNLARKSVVLEISSSFEMLKLVDGASEQFGTMAGLDEDSVHHLSVAVREAVANGIKHGNACDERRRVRIEYAVRNDDPQPQVIVSVRDEGEGFDLKSLADPLAPENVSVTSGRGILFMRSFMDDVQVRSAPRGGTEVLMVKTIRQKSS